MNEKDFAELAAGAALHALSADDERRYREALVAHPEWQATVDADAETAGVLAETAATVDPPADIRSALLARIATTPQGMAADEPSSAAHEPSSADASAKNTEVEDPSARGSSVGSAPAENSSAGAAPKAPRRWTRLAFALAACLAVLVGAGIGAVALNAQLNRPASVVALEQIESASDAQQSTVELEGGATATAHWSGSVGKAVLVTEGMPAPADGKTYELWFVRGDAPVSAGVFDVDDGNATALLAGQMQAGDAIAVTVEQEGGSPTGQPTTDPVMVIPTA